MKKLDKKNIHENIINTLLECPHKDVKNIINMHNDICKKDPIFYYQLWNFIQENTLSDNHQEVFIAKMFLSKFPEHRKKASELLQSLSPYQINNIIDHIKGKSKILRDNKIFEERLGKNIPRIFNSAVKKYIRNIESNKDLFDSTIIEYRKYLKSLYCRIRISPGNNYVRKVLFNDIYKRPRH